MQQETVNYSKLGFKSGLEIHQQLDTRKLFCNCPSILRVDEPDYLIKRKLHLVAGESGEVDEAAKHESGFGKEFIYQGYSTNCLVEADEEPPHKINEEALKIAIHISLLLNATIIPITQIMRKTVIDGSNTAGFQRTVMIARDGYVETSFGRVGITGIYLEEDSARPVLKEGNKITYRLDRLGIPLVEISTAPDIKNAEQAKETALKIGEILRSCKVKRGIGTIRQDINLSIKGSSRVELKGFQDPKIMTKTIENEVLRQFSNIGEEDNRSEVRNVLPDGTSEFLRPMPGAARMYPETDLSILKISKSLIDECKRNLPRLREDIGEDLKKEGLSEEYINLLFKQNKIEEYKQAYYQFPKPNLIANLILVFPKEISTRKKISLEKAESIISENLLEVIDLVNKKKIQEKDIKNVFERVVDGKSLNEAIKIERVQNHAIEEHIMNLIKHKPGLSENAYMGLVMKEFKGKISGNEVMEIIKKYTS